MTDINNKSFDFIKSKILSDKNALHKIKSIPFKNKKVVFSNGCFDIIHRGHVEYLAKASELGNFFVIGLNSDESVRRLKGKNRPIQDENSRALVLAAFGFVDAVVIFNQDTPYELIKTIQPDILVKGADYRPEDIVGYDIVKNKGGEVKTIELVQGFSTTNVINRLNDSKDS